MELKPCPFCGMSVADVDSVANHELMDEYGTDFDWCSKHYDVVYDAINGGCGASTGKGYETSDGLGFATENKFYKIKIEEYPYGEEPHE